MNSYLIFARIIAASVQILRYIMLASFFSFLSFNVIISANQVLINNWQIGSITLEAINSNYINLVLTITSVLSWLLAKAISKSWFFLYDKYIR